MTGLLARVMRWMSAPVEASLDRHLAAAQTLPIPEQRSISPDPHPRDIDWHEWTLAQLKPRDRRSQP